MQGWGGKENGWKMVKSEEKGQRGKEREEGHGKKEWAKKHLWRHDYEAFPRLPGVSTLANLSEPHFFICKMRTISSGLED